MASCIKQVLFLSRQRLLSSALFITISVPAEKESSVAVIHSGREGHAADSGKKSHSLGPPHVHAWCFLISSICAISGVEASHLDLLNGHLALIDTEPQSWLSSRIRVLKSKLTYDKTRLLIEVHATNDIKEIVDVAVSILVKFHDAIVMNGTAPPSGLERMLQSIIE